MRLATTPQLIDVQALRVGMYVHLDVGWMSHPFPRSSFKITSPQQVATIRALGLKQVHWNPQESDVPPVDVNAGEDGDAMASVKAAARYLSASPGDAADSLSAKAPVDATIDAPAVAPVIAAPPPPAIPARVTAEPTAERRRQLAEERAALLQCERRFREAARACRQLTDQVLGKPQEARVQAEALTRSLTEQMTRRADLCIRLLDRGSRRQGLDARDQRLADLAADGPGVRLRRGRRCRTSASARCCTTSASSRCRERAAPSRRQLQRRRAARLRGARRARAGAGAPDGPDARARRW